MERASSFFHHCINISFEDILSLIHFQKQECSFHFAGFLAEFIGSFQIKSELSDLRKQAMTCIS